MLDQLIKHNFPQSGVSLIFGYGSKVIKQNTKQNNSDLVDIIIVVDNPRQWHEENFKRNKQHYSFLRYLPNNIEKITKIQENVGARIYFNPFVNLANLSIKYGVIKTDHLIEDLSLWNKIYVAGRLHKPVEFIVNTCDENEPLRSAMRFNKESAIRVAMLLQPESSSLRQLYETITGISYNGDHRMMFGEDRNKISNIVSFQLDKFDQLYLPIIRANFKDYIRLDENNQSFSSDLNPTSILKNLKLLPLNLRLALCECHARDARTMESDAILASVSRSINFDKILARATASIVRRSSLSQSLKGLLTAGFVKSLKYSQRKLTKSLVSRINWT